MSTNGNGSGGADNGGNAPSGEPHSPITDSLSKPLPKRFHNDGGVD